MEYDPAQTRWLYRDEELAHFVKTIMASVATCHTAGPIPAITVVDEETSELVTAHGS